VQTPAFFVQGNDDRGLVFNIDPAGGRLMRRSSIIMLIAAVALGLVAVFFARSFLGTGGSNAPSRSAVRTVPTVVAAADIGFGEKLTPPKLKLVDWPADSVPAGSFQRIDDLTNGIGRTAMRPIVANEHSACIARSAESLTSWLRQQGYACGSS